MDALCGGGKHSLLTLGDNAHDPLMATALYQMIKYIKSEIYNSVAVEIYHYYSLLTKDVMK